MAVAADCSSLEMGALLVQRQAYNCVFNVLQAHAAAVQEFRSVVPDGRISINLNSDWGEPYNPSSDADKVRPPFCHVCVHTKPAHLTATIPSPCHLAKRLL